MATTADLIAESKRHLLSFQREPMNKLASSVTSIAGTLTLTNDVSNIQEASHLQVGLELFYVWAVDQSSKVVTVERAQLGSVAAAHTAGAIVTVNPKFPDFAILKALNDELLDLSTPANGLYAIRSVDLTAANSTFGYDLTGATGLLEVLAVERSWSGGVRGWTPVTNFELRQQSSLTDFPSGYGLHLREGVSTGQRIRVLYKAAFSPLVNLTDDVQVVTGLPPSMHDIPPLGAAALLVAPREIKRNFTESQGESRRGVEVPPGAVGASSRALEARRARRINDEASRLSQQFPDRGFIPMQTYSSATRGRSHRHGW